MKKLWFCGLHRQRVSSATNSEIPVTNPVENEYTSLTANSNNEVEWHTAVCRHVEYMVPKRYKDLSFLGQGSFGCVVRAKDTVANKTVAIKKLTIPFVTRHNAKRAYRELKLLMYLNNPCGKTIQLQNVFTPDTNIKQFRSLYFVFDYYDYTLRQFIEQARHIQEEHIKFIIYSLLRGLKFIHSAGIIHRDLKPENIGIDRESNVAILDFGMSRVASNDYQTGYVTSRWWRAPEVFLNWQQYTEKIDIWSIGCIMAELITCRPPFPGNDHIDQLRKILRVTGTPDLKVLREICDPKPYQFICELGKIPRQNFQRLFGYKHDQKTEKIISGVSDTGVDLLDRLLSFDYRQRPTAAEALAHSFFECHHNPSDEPTVSPMVDEHEGANYNIQQWKSIIWKLVNEFQPSSKIRETIFDN